VIGPKGWGLGLKLLASDAVIEHRRRDSPDALIHLSHGTTVSVERSAARNTQPAHVLQPVGFK
jgi:hypothetical protein